MKRLVLLIALAGCEDKSQGNPPPAADIDFGDVCHPAVAALANATCVDSANMQPIIDTRKQLDALVGLLDKLGTSDPNQHHVTCARTLLATEETVTKTNCKVPIDRALRERMTKLLAAYAK